MSRLQDSLREERLDDLAEFVEGDRDLSDLSINHFDEALVNDWIVQLQNDEETIQYAKSTTDELIQVRDGDRDGDFGRPFPAYPTEFEDYLLSQDYEVSVLFPEDSAFEVAEA